jgi:hypothetical protein
MRNHYTKELLEPVIAVSKTWSEVCRKLGVTPATGAQTHLKKKALSLGINANHFLGRAFNKGRTFKKKPIQFWLKKNSNAKSHPLRLRLISAGLKEAKCEGCGLVEWRGKKIPLELHHKNEDHCDNRLENLSVLCPNCHAQE